MKKNIGAYQFQQTNCTTITKIAFEFCKSRNIKAEPLVVRCQVLNPPMVGYLKNNCTDIQLNDIATALKEERAFIRACGYPPNKNDIGKLAVGQDWRGHLVLLVENSLALDLTFNQMSLPHHGIILPEIHSFEVSQQHLNSKGLSIYELNGCMALYEFFKGEHSYLPLDVWKNGTTENAKVARFVSEMIFKYRRRSNDIFK